MTDLIRREDALDTLDRTCDLVCRYSKPQRSAMCGACELGSAFDAIEAIHAVDAVEVKHGYWERVHDDVCYWSQCSVCGGLLPLNHWRQEYESAFCPACGAKMDRRREDGDDRA